MKKQKSTSSAVVIKNQKPAHRFGDGDVFKILEALYRSAYGFCQDEEKAVVRGGEVVVESVPKHYKPQRWALSLLEKNKHKFPPEWVERLDAQYRQQQGIKA